MKSFVVKEKVRNHIKRIEHMNNKQVLADPFSKAYHPVCSENTQSTWVDGIAYDFWIIRAQKKFRFKKRRSVL
jgi:hypothetical protein